MNVRFLTASTVFAFVVGSFVVGSFADLAPAQAPGSTGAPAADLSEAGERVLARDYAMAEELLTDLQVQFPDDPALQLMLGEVLLMLGEPAEAGEALRRAAELAPDRPRVHFQLASAQAALGETQAALDSYHREVEINGDAEVVSLAHMNRSLLFQRLHQWSAAAAEIETFLQLKPEEVQAFGDWVTLHLRGGDPTSAANVLARAEEAGFVSAQHHFDLGAAYYKAGDSTAALHHFSRAIEVEPEMSDAERSLAAVLDRLDRRSEAAGHLRRYLELRPDAPDRKRVESRLAEGT